jgi:APA family basic amino acid/polyamine antiporter
MLPCFITCGSCGILHLFAMGSLSEVWSSGMELRKELSLFDVVNIVIGSIIGADIYIASALTAGLVGPLAIIIWIIAGILAAIIALVFAYCSYYVPRVGGPFAYVSAAFDDFFGFLTGWSMWIAEILSLPVFAIAFVQYLQYLVPMGYYLQTTVKALFVITLTLVNILGVKAAGRVNDALTLVKLLPLVMLIVAGFLFIFVHPKVLAENYVPLAPLGFGGFGTALVLVFWAYVGFELGTLPASEMKDPQHMIPKAIAIGLATVTLFYLLTNFVVYGTVNWTVLAANTTPPLILVGAAIMGSFGALIMMIGALFSVSGSDESGTLGTARLSYAMSIDGLFPRSFSIIHPKYGTPAVALIVQGIIAFILSVYSDLPHLISFAVFNLAFSFLLTCCALIVLKDSSQRNLPGQDILPWLGILICLYLLFATSWFDKIVGGLVILIGIPIYVFFSPKTDIRHLKELFLSEEAIFIRQMERKNRYLANFIQMVHRLYKGLHHLVSEGSK